MRKKLFAVIMSAMMLITFMPTMAFAASCPSNHASSTIKFVSWSADYSKANFKVVCNDCEKQLATFSVATKRIFDANYEDATGTIVEPTKGFKKISSDASTLLPAASSDSGAIYTYVQKDKIDTGAAVALTSEGITSTAGPAANLYKYALSSADDTLDDGEEICLTVYYNFTNAKLCNNAKEAYTEMGADNYLDTAYLVTSADCQVALEEPSNIDSFNTKPHYAIAKFERWGNDKAPYFAARMQDVEELFAGGFGNHTNAADRDVRLDITAPQYAPYEDNISVNMTLKFQKFADVEGIIVGGDVTQAVKILSGADDIKLNHYIYNVKGEALPETSGSASGEAKKLDVRPFTKVWDNESEAKRASATERTSFGPLTYIGEDVGFEIATKNVTVQYGAIDAVGNVTWNSEAPVIKDVKMNPEGFYSDTDYHFLVKVTKGSKTRYAHMVVKLAPATLKYGFAYSELYVAEGEKLNKKSLLDAKVSVGSNKYVDVYACDKGTAQSFLEKYVDIDNFDNIKTDVQGKKKVYLTYNGKQVEKDKKTDAELAQFLTNYTVSSLIGEADLSITDQYNHIKASNKIKTYHIKNAAKLKKTKTFKLKATANHGKVTFKKITAKYGKIKVASNGKVTVKKGLKKGTYRFRVQISAPCKAVKRIVTVKIVK